MSDPSAIQHPLSFRSLIGRFKLIGVDYVAYRDGTGFFVVPRKNRPQPFPFAPSLRAFVGKHTDNDPIPNRVIAEPGNMPAL